MNDILQSTIASDELRKSQNRNPPLRLIQNVATRWNSTFFILERFLKLIDTISSVLVKLPRSPPMLSASEAAIVRELIEVLRLIEIVSREMCGQVYVTSSRIIPTIVETLSPITQKFKTDIHKELNKRFNSAELNPLSAASTVLDPRFKKLHFSTAMSCSKVIQKINEQLKNDKLKKLTVVEEEKKSCANKYENDQLWKFHLELVQSKKMYKTNVVESAGLHPDLQQYLSKEPVSLDVDPIQYWCEQKENTPALASIALKISVDHRNIGSV
ncbi:uncharacterized protein [Venturia canescens]|uniref:uncharacterized protein n=1 Tax=Venturia canescens TaxID=32260 RepID=UPI001C9BFE1B|nr:uncharacterized protein LOC122406269 [Venturia canescens]